VAKKASDTFIGEIKMTKQRLRIIIGENIRNERIARNISIDELAEMLDLTSGFVGLIERGQRGTTPCTLYKLSDVFGLDIDNFFRGVELGLSVGEERLPKSHAKRKKIESLIAGFNEMELDFAINVLKGMREMNRAGLDSEVDDWDED